MSLSVDHIHKKHKGNLVVAQDICFTIEKGELGALIGPSGCGKTTLLRMIAGFETPDSGSISINGQEMVSSGRNLSPDRRHTGMVFQDYALFPHLTVMENIRFGPVKSKRSHLDKLIRITGLLGSEKKYPHELSGGQQQRVALARALAPRPALLLMDEPFSNLDVSLRESLSEEVRFILREFDTTGLLVTHNQHEAFAMADRIGVMKDGRLLQWDTAQTLYSHPVSADVAGFVGEGSFIRGHRSASGSVETLIGSFADQGKNENYSAGITLFVRPEDVFLDHKSPFKARLIKSHFRGPGRLHTFELDSKDQFTCLTTCPIPLDLDQEYGISICNRHVSMFDIAR